MTDLDLLLDLHLPNPRQGPGNTTATLRALELSGLRGREGLQIADLGCGTGASTLVLAEHLDAELHAVDFLEPFLDVLRREAATRPLKGRVHPVVADFADLPFAPGSLDAIWSEGAIYNLGFEAGVAAWKPLLRPGGVLAVSELTWLTAERPAALQAHWDAAYPEVDTASAKLAVLERHGFTPIGYFPLPEAAWLDAYYGPLRARFPAFLAAHPGNEAARAIVAEEEEEMALYEAHRAHVSYGFYIARRADHGSSAHP